MWEDAEAFHVEAEVPGLTQDQLQVAVTHKTQLLIQGERQPQEPAEGRWHRRERGQGRFQRLVELPAPVDADKVEAKLENGLLFLTLPKARGSQAAPHRRQGRVIAARTSSRGFFHSCRNRNNTRPPHERLARRERRRGPLAHCNQGRRDTHPPAHCIHGRNQS